jgi:hypothetical protein
MLKSKLYRENPSIPVLISGKAVILSALSPKIKTATYGNHTKIETSTKGALLYLIS